MTESGKKWAALKTHVRARGHIIDAVYEYPYTYVAWEYKRDGRIYRGRGFSKYSTEDMASLTLPYSVDRGHDIAEGRAIAHCARQVLETEESEGINLDDVLGTVPVPEPVLTGMPGYVAS